MLLKFRNTRFEVPTFEVRAAATRGAAGSRDRLAVPSRPRARSSGHASARARPTRMPAHPLVARDCEVQSCLRVTRRALEAGRSVGRRPSEVGRANFKFWIFKTRMSELQQYSQFELRTSGGCEF